MGCAQGKEEARESLRNASRIGDFATVRRMLDKGTNPNIADEVLVITCLYSQFSIILNVFCYELSC